MPLIGLSAHVQRVYRPQVPRPETLLGLLGLQGVQTESKAMNGGARGVAPVPCEPPKGRGGGLRLPPQCR